MTWQPTPWLLLQAAWKSSRTLRPQLPVQPFCSSGPALTFAQQHASMTSYYWLLQRQQLQSMLSAEFGFAPAGLVHTRQQMTRGIPFDEGKPWQCITSWSAAPRLDKTGLWLFCEQQLLQHDQLICQSRSEYLSRQRWPGAPEHKPIFVTPEYRQAPTIASHQFKLIEGWRYAWHSGDWNPIHLASLPAKWFGLPQAIIHGMACIAWFEQSLPVPPSSIDASFIKPIFYGPPLALCQPEPHRWQLQQQQRLCVEITTR